MTTLDDWPRVKRVLAEALEREGEGRESYLAEACGTDAELRGRIDRLLATGDQVGAFLETAAVFLEANVHEDLSGRVVDSYRLVSRLAAGGMGQVYLAHDTKLDRPVALKFLSPELTADGDRVRRFRQEARAASSLNHPHIVVVHDFGELGGRPYIVTELIEGETLRRRLQQGPLPMRDVLDVGVQVAGALAAAHARGLVHRDVKPENIMVRPDGYAKVLDFGLAKLTTVTPSAGPVDREGRTRTGMVMGTPRYMSPEQARGLDLDARSDVWSLGVVLYEMGTGRLPFAEDGTVMQFEADRDPHVAASGRDLPPELLGIVSKALHTVRDLRYQNGAELHTALKEVQRQTLSARSGEADAIVPPRRRSGAAWLTPGKVALVALLALAVALVSVAWMRRDGAPSPTGVQRTVAVLPFDNVTGAAEIDHLRLALADEVTNALSGAPSLAVRAMASSRRFVGGGVSPQQAGRELRAGTVVTGHFSVNESELRITVEAVEVEGDRLLWRETIAAPSADSIALRDRLMSRIRDGLLPALGTTATAAARARPRNAEAYAQYLKSLALSTDPGPTREAISLLERASALDPDHADTWDALSYRYYAVGYYSGGIEELRRSEAAARHALALDPGHTGAAARLVLLQLEAGGRLQDAYDSARRLVAQRPDSGLAHVALGFVLRYGGLLEASARECEEAFSRDPTNPRFRGCSAGFMQLGRYDRALDFIRLDSGSQAARLLTRLVYQRMGRRHDAREEHRQQSPDYPSGLVPASFHGFIARCLSGAAPDGQARLPEEDVRTFLTRSSDSEPLYFFGSDLAYCGDTAAAVRLLRESIRRNYCAAVAMETDPMVAAIRNRPEYGELLKAARACRDRFQEHVTARASE